MNTERTATLVTKTDHVNESESFGWSQDSDGTWTGLTLTRSKSGFKTERGAKQWFIRNATDSQRAALGL